MLISVLLIFFMPAVKSGLKSQNPKQTHILGYCRHVVKQYSRLLTGGPVLYVNVSAYY